MIKCVRCGQMVDETARTTCPHCFTPLVIGAEGAHPAPVPQEAPPVAPVQYMPGTVVGNKRVSLTGELIDIDAPSAPPAYAGGSMAAAPPPPPPVVPASTGAGLGVRKSPGVKGKTPPASMPPPPPSGASTAPPPVNSAPATNTAPPVNSAPRPTARPASSAPVRPASASSSKNSSGTGIAILLLVIVALGAGGYWFMQNRTNPKDNAEKWMRALLLKDYKTTFELTNWAKDGKVKSVDDWKKVMQKQEDMGALGKASPDELLAQLNVKVTKVDEPTTSDSGTLVPITVKASVMGQDITQVNQIPMKKVNGVWKVELPGGNLNSVLKQ